VRPWILGALVLRPGNQLALVTRLRVVRHNVAPPPDNTNYILSLGFILSLAFYLLKLH